MAENTPRLGLPYIIASQAQKEVTHNESLNIIDALLTPCVQYLGPTPPATPTEGLCYIVGIPAGTSTAISGAWIGHANNIAQYIGGAWVFYTPATGCTIWNIAGNYNLWDGGHWLTLSGITFTQSTT